MRKIFRKVFVSLFVSAALLISLLPTSVFAADETVENAPTFSFIGGTTTQDDIDAKWGKGAVSLTSEDVDGEMVYTIKLLKNINMKPGNDVRIGEYRENGPALPQMILDLNGCTITSQSIGLINWGDLIIRDTSEDKTGGITYSTTSDKSSLVAISHKVGLLVIEDGTFTCESGYAITGHAAAVSTQAGATTHIKGGTFVSNSSAVLSAGDTIVYGGSFEAPYGMYAKSADGVPGTITIPEESTAEVTASSFALVIQRDGETDGVINAAGGTYNAPGVVGGVRKPDTNTNVTITGGSYTKDPSGWVPDDKAVASLTEKGETTPSYYAVGADDITSMAAKATEGDVISVLSGDASLTNVATGVIVATNSDGNVTVNGESVTKDNPVTVCNHIYENGVCTICGAKDPNYEVYIPPIPDDSEETEPALSGWKQDADGAWYYYENGKAVTGWIEVGGIWYYLKQDGKMATGWQYLDGKWYYLYSWGGMAKGWVLDNGIWYYLNTDGSMATGWILLDDGWYYLYSWGGMAIDWVLVDGTWYYMTDWGNMETGWILTNGKWYYLYSWGGMAANTTIDGYVLGADGAWIQ